MVLRLRQQPIYRTGAHFRETTSTDDIAPRAGGYGMPWQIVPDGNDVLAGARGHSAAVEKARRGEGAGLHRVQDIPRHHPISPAIQAGYQPKDEVEA
jgi:TPP-dependent pyruvate/acetoin dehydrogenase alpha subunit